MVDFSFLVERGSLVVEKSKKEKVPLLRRKVRKEIEKSEASVNKMYCSIMPSILGLTGLKIF